MTGLVPFGFLISSQPWHIYCFQALQGVAMAMAVPAWAAIFTRHIDREHEGIEWGVYQTLVDLGSAGAASLGGFLAFRFGFTYLFILVSIASFIGSFFLLGIYKNMRVGKISKPPRGKTSKK